MVSATEWNRAADVHVGGSLASPASSTECESFSPRLSNYDRLAIAPTVGETAPPTLGAALRTFALGALATRRVQLTGAFVLAVALPALVRWRMDAPEVIAGAYGSPFVSLSLANAVIGTTVAMILGFVAMRQMKAHPGVRSIGYIVYSFAVTYGLLGLAFLFVRADYSRYEIVASFALANLWFIAVDHVTSRRTMWRLAFVPGVSREVLPSVPRVQWRPVLEPHQNLAGATGVVADLRAAHSPEWERFLARCALDGVPVYDVRQVTEWLTGKVKVQNLAENTLSSTLARTVYLRLKRLVDLVGVAVAAPFFAAIILAAAVAIRLEGSGPALFTQVRMGYRGRPFTIFKLRTMHADASATGHAFTAEQDPRITRVGAFLRKYRIDEFPQIWNILKGEMSWIGPRPEAAALAEWYEEEVPFYCYRHMVRPGITGWAQVHQGNVAMIDAATEKLHYDFYYIKNFSLCLDALIGAKTVQTVLSGFGSR